MSMHPGPQIARARSRAGISQRDLAERAGVSPTTVRKIERQEIDPHEHTLGKIYNVLGWPDEPDGTRPVNPAGYDARISQLDPDDVRYVEAIIEAAEKRKGIR